ncbi:MAG: hypothetical protein HND57_12705 [Planctomycetes bacterium]|nr:hypothetical protein [Planctomycetota bacterium]
MFLPTAWGQESSGPDNAERSEQPDTSFTYRGQLLRHGAPMSDLVDFELTLWDTAEDGNQIGQPQWVIGHYVIDGLFSLTLDFGPDAFGTEPRWLEITVLSSADTEPVTLAPRQRIAATPLALYALNSPQTPNVGDAQMIRSGNDSASGATRESGITGAPGRDGRNGRLIHDGVRGGDDQLQDPTADPLWNENGSDIYFDTGNVGIGTNTPSNPLQVENANANGTAIVGWARSSGSNTGVYGLASGGSGTGVYGLAKATSNTTTFGGRFESRSNVGRGVFGIASAHASTPTYGGWFQSNSSKGRGIQGFASSATGKTYGGLFQSNSDQGYGLYAYAGANTGTNYALYAKTRSPDGYAGFFAGGRNYFQGNVGIGTTNPAVPLHTTGAVTFESGWRLEPTAGSPNLIGGHVSNSVEDGLEGVTIAGGGYQGTANTVTDYGDYGTIGGGYDNHVSGYAASVSGGSTNTASSRFSTVSGGSANTADGLESTVSGGSSNHAEGAYAVVSGGSANVANGLTSTVAGGWLNATSADWSTVSGGWGNAATYDGSTVSGGYRNEASDLYSTVSGGSTNVASGPYSTASGGSGNAASRSYSTASGGRQNTASGDKSTVSGGASNAASDLYSTVSGGSTNVASGEYATVSGGYRNEASDQFSTVSGGSDNTASGGFSTVSGGRKNAASGTYSTVSGGSYNTASGSNSTVAGGLENSAVGPASFAAGTRAKAIHDGTFVWGDHSSQSDVESSRTYEWTIRSTGGVRFFTSIDLSTGATLAPGGSSWSAVSDRNRKEHFEPLDSREVLRKVSAIPMTTWNYKSQDPSIRHMGPMAQDFSAAFGLGADELRINTIDADGVALAAIQGLHSLVVEQESIIDAQADRIDSLEDRLEILEKQLNLPAIQSNSIPGGAR